MGTICVSNLGKAYKQYPNHWSRLAEWMLPAAGKRHELKWVLKDINFSIAPGEAVGIIGVNGAGKSTLLKLITGTAQPSSGSVALVGRVAALLELGMGFHPDFTGRQNALMAGQLLGLSGEEVNALMPAIESFAEIGDYINQPVRVYSSGMQMRLAFSVATCVRPDILIVDEALAVGDVFFQQKCFERIQGFTKAGTTLLFVSHSTGTVMNICDRCIFLRDGAVVCDGAPKEAIDLYQADLLVRQDHAPTQITVNTTRAADAAIAAPVAPEAALSESTSAETSDVTITTSDRMLDTGDLVALTGSAGSLSTDKASCIAVEFVDTLGRRTNTLIADREATMQIAFRFHAATSDPHVGFKIRNRFGTVLFESNTYCMKQPLGAIAADRTLVVRFSFLMAIWPDEYTITVGLADGGYGAASFKENLSYLNEVSAFTVLPNTESITWAGIVNLNPGIEFEQR